jgi:hypothetical protein
MKIRRKLNVARILLALVITVLVFSLGVTLGYVIDSERVRWSERESSRQRVDYESLQWQYLYLSTTESREQTCLVLHTALEDSVANLGYSLDKMQSYQQMTQINDADYELLARSYALNNLKYWLLATKTKSECGGEYVIILYFFSEKACSICSDQGVILTYYKKIYGDRLLVFPINIDMEKSEPAIKTVKNVYNVTTLPAIVVEQERYDGVVDSDRLGEIICSSFSNQSSCMK